MGTHALSDQNRFPIYPLHPLHVRPPCTHLGLELWRLGRVMLALRALGQGGKGLDGAGAGVEEEVVVGVEDAAGEEPCACKSMENDAP